MAHTKEHREDVSSGAQRAAIRTETAWEDLVRTGPGTLGGRYLRSFWQPVLRAQDIAAGRALPIRIMSQDFTLYRGESGAAHLLPFRCAHRGTQLSTGWVEGDALRCFYHGWKYDGSGNCIEQPAEPEPFCQRIRIRGYPTVEYLGLIFAYLGEDGEPPSLPRYADFEEDGVRDVRTWVRGCNYFNGLDHRVDYANVEFTHRKSTAPRGVYSIPSLRAEESDWGMTTTALYPDGVVRIMQFGMPNVHHQVKLIDSDLDSGWTGGRDSIQWRVPVDDEHHAAFNVELVRIGGEARRKYERDRIPFVERSSGPELAEAILRGELRSLDLEGRRDVTYTAVHDYVAEAGVGVIADRSAEQLGQSDASVALLRQIWARELGALKNGRALTRWHRPSGCVASESPLPTSGSPA